MGTAVSKVFSEHYPEFKGKTMFINFPGVFAKPFQAFALLLPPRTRMKFVILGKDEHYALFEHITPDLIPDTLGGLLTTPPGKLTGQAKSIHLTARAAEEVNLVEVEKDEKVGWEIRVCVG